MEEWGGISIGGRPLTGLKNSMSYALDDRQHPQ